VLQDESMRPHHKFDIARSTIGGREGGTIKISRGEIQVGGSRQVGEGGKVVPKGRTNATGGRNHILTTGRGEEGKGDL